MTNWQGRAVTELDIIKFEKKHPDLLLQDSAAQGLYYATKREDCRIAVLSTGGMILLNKEQAYSLAEEIKYMFDTYTTRGHTKSHALSALLNEKDVFADEASA